VGERTPEYCGISVRTVKGIRKESKKRNEGVLCTHQKRRGLRDLKEV
jgi:hypothetical protein